MLFFVGLHQPHDAKHFERCMVSINRIRERRSPFTVGDWMLDSAAFTELYRYGRYRHEVEEYAAQIRRWKVNGNLVAAAAQDYLCAPPILERTGLSVAEHQRLTIERYDALLRCDTGAYIMPVLQGFAPREYMQHIAQYGDRLMSGMWVGVGSVAGRSSDIGAIESVVGAIKQARPDLRLHLFGCKTNTFESSFVRESAYSADSMAWSFAARREGRNANDWREAQAFVERIAQQPTKVRGYQMPLWQ